MSYQHMALWASLFALATHSCSPPSPVPESPASSLPDGVFRFSLQLGSYELPFTAELLNNSVNPTLTIANADENIAITDLRITKDSIVASLPVYKSMLLGRIESPEFISGTLVSPNKKQPLEVPFIAEFGKDYRFTNTKSSTQLPTRYKAIFNPDKDDEYPAILLLDNNQGKLTATFLTETGDYRYLEGNIMNERVYLSTFDGSHAFYFEAAIDGDELKNGIFLSGPNYTASWNARADSSFELTHPEQLTFQTDPKSVIELNFPNQEGDTLGWEGLGLNNKVVIIDIFGSWCPNCMDASVAIKTITDAFSSDDVAVVPVAFEFTNDLSQARERVFKMQHDLGLPKYFLFGGYANKKNASASFPMLNHIMSFPTIIIVDRHRKVRQIYTGFYGPGTGSYYQSFMTRTDALLDQLVSEH